MALVFQANVNDRAQTSAAPFDSLGLLSDFDMAVQFRYDGAGTTQDNILSKGANYFVLRRKTGTSDTLEFLYRNQSGSVVTANLGAIAANTWHVLRFRWDGAAQYVYVDGVLKYTGALTGTWLDDNVYRYTYGSGSTLTGGMEVKLAQHAGWAPKLSSVEAASVDAGDAVWTDAVADVDSRDEWFRYNFLQNTSGTASNTDLGYDNANTDAASLGDVWNSPAKTAPTWDASSPIGSAAAITMQVACGGLLNQTASPYTIADGATINLGTIPKVWSDASTSAAFRVGIFSGGVSADVTSVVVSADGDGSVASGALGTITNGTIKYAVITLDASATGASSTTVTVASSEVADLTFTLTWNVQEDTSRTVTPGAGFSSPPTQSDTQVGSGDFTYRCSAQVDVGNYYWVEGDTLEVTVAAEHAHVGWIERIEVYFESDTVSKTIYTPKASPSARTGAIGFTFDLDVSGVGSGDYSFYIKAIPVEGLERQMGPYRITFNTDDSIIAGVIYLATSGNDADSGLTDLLPVQTAAQALHLCSSSAGGYKIVCLDAGVYDAASSTVADSVRASDRVNRFVLGPGLSYGDVIFKPSGLREKISYRTRKMQFEDIKFDRSKIGQILSSGSATSGSGLGVMSFLRCGFYDSVNGNVGPAFGYTNMGVLSPPGDEWYGSAFNTTSSGYIFCYETREVSGYNGLTGCDLIAGGYGGEPVSGRHNGDNIYTTAAVFAYGYDQDTSYNPFIRYSAEETLTVSTAVYDGGTNKTTVSFSGSPTLVDTFGGQLVDSLTELWLVTDGRANYNIHYHVNQANSIDNTAKAVICNGDATGDFTPGVSVFLSSIQHQDGWQQLFVDGDSNYIYNRGYQKVNGEVQPALPEITGSGDITGIWWQNVIYTGDNIWRWSENYYNCGHRQSSMPYMFNSTSSGTLTDCLMVGSMEADTLISTPDSLALGTGFTEADFDTDTLLPTEGGSLQGMYFPRLPVDYYASPVVRDGSAYFGALQPTELPGGPYSVNADGWSATYTSPPAEFDPVGSPVTFTVSRSGFNAAGSSVTVNDSLRMMKRIRQPYPSQLSLTSDQVAFSEFIHASDTIAGITNNSTRAYPLPIAKWVNRDKEIVNSSTYTARLAVNQAYARGGRPVAAVKFSATDGSTTVESTVSVMSTISYSASGLTLPHFAAELDFSGFANGATITIDAVIYPWVGEEFQISVDADTYPSPNLTTLRVLCNRTGAYGTAYAYVSPAGASGAPAVSTDPAVAEANYYGTLDAACTALKAYNNTNFGRNYCDGGVVRLLDGAAHIFSNVIRTPGATQTWPLVIEAADSALRATTILRDRGSTMANSLPDQCVFKDITIQRSGSGSWVCYDNAAANLTYTAMLAFESCLFDANGATAYAGYIYKTGNCYFINCGELSRFAQGLRLSTVNKVTHVIGSKGDFASGPVTSTILASHCIGPDVFMLTGPAIAGVPELVGQLCSHSHLQLTANAKNVFSANTTIGARGVALVGCVCEAVGGDTSPAIYLGGDGNVTPMQNVLTVGNTVAGSRMNYLYQDTGSTTIAKSGWMRWNVMQLRNTKSDVFGANANLVGNWPAIYNVGARGNAWLLGSNSDDTYLPGSWLGEVAAVGDVTGIDASPLLPDWADNASYSGSGLGGGDYTPGAATQLPYIPAGLTPYSHDLYGTVLPTDGTARAGAGQPSGDNANPTILTITVDHDRVSVAIEFDEPVTTGADDWYEISIDGIPISYVSGTGETTVYFTSVSPIPTGTVTAAFTQPGDGIQDLVGNLLETFAGKAVVNQVKTWQDIAASSADTLTISNVQAGDYGRQFRRKIVGLTTQYSNVVEIKESI